MSRFGSADRKAVGNNRVEIWADEELGLNLELM